LVVTGLNFMSSSYHCANNIKCVIPAIKTLRRLLPDWSALSPECLHATLVTFANLLQQFRCLAKDEPWNTVEILFDIVKIANHETKLVALSLMGDLCG
jgi:hypothetical protein